LNQHITEAIYLPQREEQDYSALSHHVAQDLLSFTMKLQEHRRIACGHIAMAIGTIVRSTNMAVLRAHEQYWELAKSRKRVFDDGKIFALDLRRRQEP
jgi:hypothetical protein